MGQYYIAVILGPDGEKKEFIRMWIESYAYHTGSKLMEHSYIGNSLVSAIEYMLSPKGPFWKSRLVWAGDYADEEPDSKKNLYHIAQEDEKDKRLFSENGVGDEYKYLINHTKKQYVVKGKPGRLVIHHLPLLTAEGIGRGGGDFRGDGEEHVGAWARDVISVECEVPEDYEEVYFHFEED